ncbi:hypothetical protein L1987_23743 [Smallanthus sonchifolius]|uniref:Uncharacterized protein n=1 Tax=Smallanthus sonchifolius TaxID=185202 RepID=A0ACB9IIH3_9ASTR|nr:hypothetical protein L1987_23743 [Smallanthus sonchifolius]
MIVVAVQTTPRAADLVVYSCSGCRATRCHLFSSFSGDSRSRDLGGLETRQTWSTVVNTGQWIRIRKPSVRKGIVGFEYDIIPLPSYQVDNGFHSYQEDTIVYNALPGNTYGTVGIG